jgi:hypothetical protein
MCSPHMFRETAITAEHERPLNDLHMFRQSVLESRVGYSVRRTQNFQKKNCHLNMRMFRLR